MDVRVGDKAPDLTLFNQDREPVQLSTAIRKQPVVLAFFPAAFSRVCTKEMCTFRDSSQELNRLSASVLGISVDTFFSLKAWANDQKLNFPLLSDFNKEVIARYGVWNDDLYGMKGVAKRAVFLVDQGGAVRYREVLEDASREPDYEKLQQAIANL
jgi:glutaredoxin-dependent peroxiredoxin